MLHSLAQLTSFVIVLALAYFAVVAITTAIAALRYGGRREDPADDHEALSTSRFTIPVSVIVEVGDREASLGAVVKALLSLNYPEFEVVVVVDRLSGASLDRLRTDWTLQAKEFFYRRSLETGAVEQIQRSLRDPRLMVVLKAPGGRADALNCGVNVARFRYIACVNPDVVFDSDALLRAMAPVLRDPASIVGAASHVERRGAAGGSGGWGRAFQRLDSTRSLMESRLAWQYPRHGLGPHDRVVVWRRDAVVHLEGFSTTAADCDIEMMVRLQASAEGVAATRVARTGELFGWTAAAPPGEAFRLARRRSIAALQAVQASRRSGEDGHGDFKGRAIRRFVRSELVGPLVEFVAVLAMTLGAAVGWFSWWNAVLTVVFLSFMQALVTNTALLMRAAAPEAPGGTELRHLVLLGPLEFLGSRPALALAQCSALKSWLTGACDVKPDSTV